MDGCGSMVRGNRSQVDRREEARSSGRGYDIQAAKLALWEKVGLDFCTACLSEKLAIVAGLYDGYIKCNQCGERQV